MTDYRVAKMETLRAFVANDPQHPLVCNTLRFDEEGSAVLYPVVPFMNDGSKHRVRVLAPVEGQDNPACFYLDVEVDAFAALPTTDDVLGRTK